MVGPKEDILNSIKQQDGKEILDYEAFKRLIKMIVFWKITRLDQHKTPKNVGHWQAIRNMKRAHLFGSDEAPTEKSDSVDIDYLKLLPKYISMINGMIKKEQGLQDEVTFAVCKAIGLGVKQFAESRKFYMRPGSDTQKEFIILNRLTRFGMYKARAEILGKEVPKLEIYTKERCYEIFE